MNNMNKPGCLLDVMDRQRHTSNALVSDERLGRNSSDIFLAFRRSLLRGDSGDFTQGADSLMILVSP